MARSLVAYNTLGASEVTHLRCPGLKSIRRLPSTLVRAARPLAVSEPMCLATRAPRATRLRSKADFPHAGSKTSKDPKHELKSSHAASEASQSEAGATIAWSQRREQNAEHQNSIRVQRDFFYFTVRPRVIAIISMQFSVRSMQSPNPSVERTRHGMSRRASISFLALRATPRRAAHLQR